MSISVSQRPEMNVVNVGDEITADQLAAITNAQAPAAANPFLTRANTFNTADAAVRITQNGDGDAFVVEDSTNPDSTPFRINSSGQVGVSGAIFGGSSLSVTGPSSFVGNHTQTGSISVTISSGTAVPITIQNNGTGNSFIVNDESSDTTPFVVAANGDVGIGISSPTRKLNVVGDTLLQITTGSSVPLTINNFGTGNSFVVNDVSGDTSPFVIDASGNVTLGGTLQFNADPAISSLTYKTTGLAATVDRTAFPNEVEIVIGGVTYRIPARQV